MKPEVATHVPFPLMAVGPEEPDPYRTQIRRQCREVGEVGNRLLEAATRQLVIQRGIPVTAISTATFPDPEEAGMTYLLAEGQFVFRTHIEGSFGVPPSAGLSPVAGRPRDYRPRATSLGRRMSHKPKESTRELRIKSERDVADYIETHRAERLPRSALVVEELSDGPGRAAAFRASAGGSISRRPHIESMLGSAMAIAMHELNFLMGKVKAGMKLEPDEERAFHKLVDSVGKLVREEREQRKAEGLDELDREDVMERLPDALAAMGVEMDDFVAMMKKGS